MARDPDVEPDSLSPHSSVNELKNFEESIIWGDMLRYIRANLTMVTTQLKQSSDLMEIKKLQGLVECGEDMENLPQILIEIKNQEEEQEDDDED